MKRDPRDKSYVRRMFDDIANRYDFLNHTMSCFQDILWRRACCREIRRELKRNARDREKFPGGRLLDLCGGTGDFAVTYEKFNGVQERAILGDFSYGMLQGAKGKRTSAIPVQLDAMKLPFPEGSFDVVLNGFGMRNVPDVGVALRESFRVLSPGGYLQVLEFFSPRNVFNKFFYKILAPVFIPVLGAVFSKRDAYEYLVNSVLNFYPVNEFNQLAKNCGFETVLIKPCFWGVAYRVLLRKSVGKQPGNGTPVQESASLNGKPVDTAEGNGS